MGKTTFSGPVRTGQDTGIPTTKTIGEVLLAQRATVLYSDTSANQVFYLPANVDQIKDIVFDAHVIFTPASGTDQGVANLEVGNGTTVNVFGTVPVTAVGRYTLTRVATTAGVNAYLDPGRIITAHVTAIGSTGTPSTGAGVLTVTYIQR